MQRVRRRWSLGWGYRVAVFVLWPLMKIFTRRDWQGTERLNADPEGIIVVANHLSWFDPLAISYMLWECDRPPRFLAKEGVFKSRFLGSLLRSAGQIPVYRETSVAIDAVRDGITAVDRGECLVVYPEGTITRDPGLWPMSAKTGAARIALASGRPLIPVAQWGPQFVMWPYKKQLRLIPPKVMHMRVGDPVDFSDLAGRPLDADTLRVATDRIMDAITALQADIRGETPPATRFVYGRTRQEGTAT